MSALWVWGPLFSMADSALHPPRRISSPQEKLYVSQHRGLVKCCGSLCFCSDSAFFHMKHKGFQQKNDGSWWVEHSVRHGKSGPKLNYIYPCPSCSSGLSLSFSLPCSYLARNTLCFLGPVCAVQRTMCCTALFGNMNVHTLSIQ